MDFLGKQQSMTFQKYYLNTICDKSISSFRLPANFQAQQQFGWNSAEFNQSCFFFSNNIISHYFIIIPIYFLIHACSNHKRLLPNSYYNKWKLIQHYQSQEHKNQTSRKVSSFAFMIKLIPILIALTAGCTYLQNIRKACELLISCAFVVACIFQMYKQVKAYGWKLQWRFFAILFMSISLLVNIAFCLWNDVYTLYSTESYLYSLYFLTIVGYVFRLYMRKNLWDTLPRNNHIFSAAMAIMAILYTIILIDSIIQQKSPTMINKSCEQVWYLCINVSCLTLCIFALITLYCSQREERMKILMMSYDDTKVHDPFLSLWLWIGFNTLAQIVNLIQSGLLIGTDHENNCMIIRDNEVGDNVLRFFFSIFTLTAGYTATLVYFRHVRKSSGYIDNIKLEASVDRSQALSGSYGVELFNTFMEQFN